MDLASIMAEDGVEGVALLDDDAADDLADAPPDIAGGNVATAHVGGVTLVAGPSIGAPTDDLSDGEADDDDFWEIDDEIAQYPSYDGDNGRWDVAEPELGGEVDETARRAWLALQGLIFPEYEYSDVSLTAEEYEQAQAHLAVLLDRAEQCDIAEHDSLDHALADMLAQGWPRSAPLAKLASEAFRWSDEAGHIGERPALQFLNARMAESQFLEEVQQDGHRLHEAWVELTTPGRAGPFKQFRVRKGAVMELLMLIRAHYPGLEELLDAKRVASWDKPTPTWRAWVGRWLFGMFIVLQIMGVIAAFSSDSKKEDAPLPMYTPEIGSDVRFGVEYELVARALFGGETTMDEVVRLDPVFAEELKSQIRTTVASKRVNSAREMLRQDMLRARANADDETVMAISRIYLGWLKTAETHGGVPCREIQAWQFGAIDMAPDALRAEQRLAASLLQDGLLGKAVPVAATRERTITISDEVSAKALQNSGLPAERFNAATVDPGHADRCRMAIGMIEAALDTKGDVPVELLRIL